MTDTELVEAVARAIGLSLGRKLTPPITGGTIRCAEAALSVARPIIERELLREMERQASVAGHTQTVGYVRKFAREQGVEE